MSWLQADRLRVCLSTVLFRLAQSAAALLCGTQAHVAEATQLTVVLVTRPEVVRAAISPSGAYAAWIVVKPLLPNDAYEISTYVRRTEPGSEAVMVSSYVLDPNSAFNQLTWFKPTAGDVHWISNDELLLLGRGPGGRCRISIFRPRSARVITVDERHDFVSLEAASVGRRVLLQTADIATTKGPASPAADGSVRITDEMRFFGPVWEPSRDRWVKRNYWSLQLKPQLTLQPTRQPEEGWLDGPDLAEAPQVNSTQADKRTYPIQTAVAQQRPLTADLLVNFEGLMNPAHSFQSVEVRIKGPGRAVSHTPTRRRIIFGIGTTTLLGWASTTLKYVLVTGRDSEIWSWSPNSGNTLIEKNPELDRVPCYPAGPCSVLSENGRGVLLLASTLKQSERLIYKDFAKDREIVLADYSLPAALSNGVVRYYDVQTGGGDAWANLYMPAHLTEAHPPPLVITQYLSTAGYPRDIGDEIPIGELLASGIAVLTMNSESLNVVDEGTRHGFESELARVVRPLEGMKWIVEKLAYEGIIDADRVAYAGLSYGSEIGSYTYGKWPRLRAMTLAGMSWNPGSYLFSGPTYARSLDLRGFPQLTPSGLQAWQEISPGLNAKPDLPPLLLQTPSREQNYTIPEWTELRKAGAPVEWFNYPDEGHVKIHPANKWWVYSRNLDWLRFWLQGFEDPDQSKKQQYARWRQMRDGIAGRVSSAATAQRH